jgi:chromosome segregation ATPase
MLLTAQELDRAKGHLLTGEVQSNRDVKKLQGSIQEIEADVERLRAAVDWSQGRIGELEGAMSTANAELDVRTQMSDKWEQKTREMQVKIVELEK